jgi:hypothetical protein
MFLKSFCFITLILVEGTLVFIYKKSKRSHKIVEIKVLLPFCLLMEESVSGSGSVQNNDGSEIREAQKHTDADPQHCPGGVVPVKKPPPPPPKKNTVELLKLSQIVLITVEFRYASTVEYTDLAYVIVSRQRAVLLFHNVGFRIIKSCCSFDA